MFTRNPNLFLIILLTTCFLIAESPTSHASSEEEIVHLYPPVDVYPTKGSPENCTEHLHQVADHYRKLRRNISAIMRFFGNIVTSDATISDDAREDFLYCISDQQNVKILIINTWQTCDALPSDDENLDSTPFYEVVVKKEVEDLVRFCIRTALRQYKFGAEDLKALMNQ